MYCRNFPAPFSKVLRIAFLILSVGSASTAMAASPSDLAREAEALAREGNMPAAMERMQQAADALWDLQQLKIVETTLLIDGEPQQTAILRSGEVLSISTLLTGFSYKGSEDSLAVAFAVDVDIRHTSGRVLASMQDFASVSQTVSGRVAEFSIEINLTTPALLDGDYEAAFTLRDLASGQAAQFVQDFSIEGILGTLPQQGN
ncbi:MAG: hypothetical protein NXI17_22315 [Alphaproteobacteria bacterium]|nr:hypothetical protein [Alphaproteobacteria bacterium]